MELSSSTGRRKVLLVEDEPVIALDLRAMLESIGFGIAGVAPDLRTALALAERDDVDAALLDIVLGTEPSFAVADILVRRGIPFVFSTGTDGSSVPERLRSAPLIAKPYNSKVLENTVIAAFRDAPANDAAIRETAYFLWEQDGRPHGRHEHYWHLAREKVARERANDALLEIPPRSAVE